MNGTLRPRIATLLWGLALAAVLVFFLFPLYWMLVTAFKPRAEVTLLPPSLLPYVQFRPTLENFAAVLTERPQPILGGWIALSPFPAALLNSVLIGGTATVASVLLGTFAAYAFSRFRIRGSADLLFFILSTRMLPPIVVVIPLFLMFTELGLRNTFWGLTILYTAAGLPFVVWMMKGFFDEIPREYEEAAMTDGYSRLQAIWRVVLPEALPAMLATAMFVLIFAWNEFVFAQLLNPDRYSTAPIFLYSVIGYGRVEWARMAATSVMFLVPVVAFTFLVRRHLLRGMTFGAVRR